MSSRGIAASFAAVSAALGGVAVFLTYTKDRPPASFPTTTFKATPSNSSSGGDSGGNSGDFAVPIVLPPGVPSREQGTLREEFFRRCARLVEPLGGDVAAATAGENVRCYGSYLSSLNYERGVPNWVLECFHRDTLPGEALADRSNSDFYADETVPPPFRVAPKSYVPPSSSDPRGLSRGHLAPAQLHRSDGATPASSQRFLDATFNMNANIVPQDIASNATDWLRVEKLTRSVVKRALGSADGRNLTGENRVWVVSGPAYVPRRVSLRQNGGPPAVVLSEADARPTTVRRMLVHEVVGGGGGPTVAVPTHLFKVIVAELRPAGGGRPELSTAAFLVPNRGAAKEAPLTHYLTSVPELERLLGRSILPRLLGSGTVTPICGGGRSSLGIGKCEERTSALFKHYRQVAELRAAQSVPELNRLYAEVTAQPSEKEKKEVPLALQKEYEERKTELIDLAVRDIESI